MLNIAYTHASVVLVLVGGCVILISSKVEYLDKEGSYINSSKEVI